VAGYEFQAAQNFLALPEENSDLAGSRVLILPAPYEMTTSYGGGTRRGPAAILEASRQVELYDREFDREAAIQWGIHTLPALALDLRSPETAVEGIAAAVAEWAGRGKLLCVLGGEHTVSVGEARGLAQAFGEFVTVQLDAHTDLRDSFEGTPYSHACAMRRILDHQRHVVQLGIRSLDISEAEFVRANPDRVTAFFADDMRHDRSYLQALANAVRGKQVFLTVDVDAFDPSIMPSTGTPEPGGLLWRDVLEIVRTVAANGTIIAFDCVELAPIPGIHAPDFMAAKLIYKIINIVLNSQL
jgi:agmatinase